MENEKLLKKLFENKFDAELYKEFLGEVFGEVPNESYKRTLSSSDGKKYELERIFKYKDENNVELDCLIIKSPTDSKLYRARVEQRLIVSRYMKDEIENKGRNINNILVAFYSTKTEDWRLSFVKQELDFDAGKKKMVTKLSPARRKSFLIDMDSKNITVKKQFEKIIVKDNPTVEIIENTFSVEIVSKPFFNKYTEFYKQLNSILESDNNFKIIKERNNNGDDHFQENFVKKLMGQLVFLYFIQKKGWLGVPKEELEWENGDKNFLKNLYDKSKKENKDFFDNYLKCLFYDSLNRKHKDDYNEKFNCKIPYLNGGLFEPTNNYDWENTVILTEANDLFGEMLDFFDEYNFTVNENDPLEQDIAVDPEMLGKIFENLLPDNERKGNGAYYTPREIVHYMCKESLVNYLVNKVGVGEKSIRNLFDYKESLIYKKNLTEKEKYSLFSEYEKYGKSLDDALENVKIVDPAVGSGAFPMGLLHEIVSLRAYIMENILLKKDINIYKLKKETLENNIYGVDLDIGAVEIAKLRFWLSLVVEETKPRTLPNLDYRIMQGNSLVEDIVIGDRVINILNEEEIRGKNNRIIKVSSLNFSGTYKELLTKLKFYQKSYFDESNHKEKLKIRSYIEDIEKAITKEKLEEEIENLQDKIDNIESQVRNFDRFKTEQEIDKIEEYMMLQQEAKERISSTVRNFFPWKLYFWDVFQDNGGFDIVLGNPPYVSSWNMGEDLKNYYSENYNTATGHYDLYVLFFEIGYKVLKESGEIGLITSNKFLSQKYGIGLRDLFLENTIKNIINFNFDVFENATVDTCILILQKEKSHNYNIKVNDIYERKDYNVFLKNEYKLINQNFFREMENNLFRLDVNEEDISVLQKIKTNVVRLDRICYISKGAELHSIKSLGIGKGDYIYDTNINNKLKKYIEGKFFSKYAIYKNKIHYLDYQPTKHKAPVFKEFFESKKLIFKNVIGKLGIQGVYDEIGFYNNDALNNAILYKDLYGLSYSQTKKISVSMKELSEKYNLKFLLSILNSRLMGFFYKKLIGFGLHFYPSHLKQLPIRISSEEQQKKFIFIVDEILSLTQQENYEQNKEAQEQVKKYEKEIDVMVYKLYDLTYEEVKIVDEEFEMTEEEYNAYVLEGELDDAQIVEEEKAIEETKEELNILGYQVRALRTEIAIAKGIEDPEVFSDKILNLLLEHKPTMKIQLEGFGIDKEIVEEYGERILANFR